MKAEQDYIRDITEMRSMMERSSKFLSLSGLAGILAGTYGLAGTLIAWKLFDFTPREINGSTIQSTRTYPHLEEVIFLGITVFILAMGTAIFLSYKKAAKKGENLWNPTSRRLLINMAVPLVAGGILVLILLSKDLAGLIPAVTLLFYGLALYNASKFTYEVVRVLGLTEIILGLISAYFIEYSLIFWAIGFGIVHIIYGIYMHYRYEK